jgi:hypothetical protein
MFSKSVFFGLMIASQFALAGNGIERIKLVGGIDYAIVPALQQALTQECQPAASLAYEVVAEKLSEGEHAIDQGQVDITYDLYIKLLVDPTQPINGTTPENSTGELYVPVHARVAKYAFSNPTVSNVEVLGLSGPGCQK